MTMPRRPTEPSVAVVLPIRQLREAGEPVVVRRPGRPRRVATAPTIDERAYHEAVAAAVGHAIEQDEVVTATSADDPKLVIERTMVAVACEAAALGWDRIKSQNEGRADAEKISSRRVAALCRLADLVVVREQMQREAGEMSDEDVGRASDLFIQEMEETAREVAPVEVAEAFISTFRQKVAAAHVPGRTAP